MRFDINVLRSESFIREYLVTVENLYAQMRDNTTEYGLQQEVVAGYGLKYGSYSDADPKTRTLHTQEHLSQELWGPFSHEIPHRKEYIR